MKAVGKSTQEINNRTQNTSKIILGMNPSTTDELLLNQTLCLATME